MGHLLKVSDSERMETYIRRLMQFRNDPSYFLEDLTIETVVYTEILKTHFKIEDEIVLNFYDKYKKNFFSIMAFGQSPDEKYRKPWNVIRNNAVLGILLKMVKNNIRLFEKHPHNLKDVQFPTREHAKLLLWGFTPNKAEFYRHFDKYLTERYNYSSYYIPF